MPFLRLVFVCFAEQSYATWEQEASLLLTAAPARLRVSALQRYPKTKQEWALIAQNLDPKTKLQDNW